MRLNAVVVCGLSSILVVSAVGCGKIVEKIQQKAVETAVEKGVESQSDGKIKLDLNGQKASVTTSDGKTQASWGQGATAPADFPKQVPLYPGATVVSSISDRSTLPNHTVILKTADPGAKVADYYKGELKDFKLEQDVDMGKSHVLKFVEPKLSVQIMAAEEGPSSTNVVLHTEAMQ